ncbi:MAG: response regulator, partial [Deltaproteobacteria bacterium]|nr:response regulator [Deltaproteobacteria bacterium]
ASEVTRVAKEVGTEGKLGGQAEVAGVAGVWKNLTDNVNTMARNLTTQVRGIVKVVTAVANGDLKQKLVVDAKGEVAALAETINNMTDTLGTFAEQVSNVAREVGVEGKLGGQAKVPGAAGTWKDLTDNVNFMASNLTTQVRGIVKVVTAVANGALQQKLVVDAKGEVAALADTINGMTDTLSTFAEQVTNVAREVGIEGKLGGQAKVPGAMGTWRELTDNVNQLAANLTTQVRAISEVANAVTTGDLTRSIAVEAEGEVAALKDTINQMITNLRETTEKNTDQHWLKTNLARFSSMMQGQKNLETVSRLIMSELTPLVSAHHGAFFMGDLDATGTGDQIFRLTASYAYKERKNVANRFRVGEGLVGQAALERKSILLTRVPSDYIQINSGLGEGTPLNVIVLPVLFEGTVKAVIELASFHPFSAIHLIFLDQLMESIGVVLNMIMANMRTEDLLNQSQKLTQDLQNQSSELTQQQEKLKRSNAELGAQAVELEDKARLLEEQNDRVEIKNREVEQARASLEEKAAQLAMISKYKSEFLANMSHELRTPLNSLLILSKLLADNKDANLTDKQTEWAKTIYASGGDLLALINEILDLSKVEAGKMQVEPRDIPFGELVDFVTRTFQPVADQKNLAFKTTLVPGLSKSIRTDPQRLQQVLKNLLSNAFKFTETGSVELKVAFAERNVRFSVDTLRAQRRVLAFAVVDTGIGIARDKQRLIFEAFQQADGTTSRKYGGTGLGLSISREITRLLGGEIVVDSTPGKGSSFTLYLPEYYSPIEGSEADPKVPPAKSPVPPRSGQASTPQPARQRPEEPAQARNVPSPAVRPTPRKGASPTIADDRTSIRSGDRVLLVIEDDVKFAEILLGLAREQGFKVVVETSGDTGIETAERLRPDAITLDIQLPVVDGWTLLDRLKRNPRTRHIPVHVITVVDDQHHAAALGAFAYMEKPVGRDAVLGALAHVTSFLERGARRLLVVEDDDRQRQSVIDLLGGGDDLEIVAVGSADEAIRALEGSTFDCIICDLMLPDSEGTEGLERIKTDPRFKHIPVVVYTGKDLSREEEQSLKRYAASVIMKGETASPERLIDDTALFLHRVAHGAQDEVDEEAPTGSAAVPIAPQVAPDGPGVELAGRKVLVVDDDARNIFAITSVLEMIDMTVIFAGNGVEALKALEDQDGIDIVLMDVMMPEMDGYEAMRRIRADDRFDGLPVIAITAKALQDDRDKCIAAGASDYLPKPIDSDKLVELMKMWIRP